MGPENIDEQTQRIIEFGDRMVAAGRMEKRGNIYITIPPTDPVEIEAQRVRYLQLKAEYNTAFFAAKEKFEAEQRAAYRKLREEGPIFWD